MEHNRTLGKISAKLISQLYDIDKAIFTINDACKILGKDYFKITDLLSELVKRKIITRLKAGKFLIIPQELSNAKGYMGDWFVAGREIVNSSTYYIAFYSAMHYWGMLTQPLVKIFVATPKRQVIPIEMRKRLIFVYIQEKNIWGINDEWVTGTEKVRISDLERTIIDALTHPEYCGGVTEIAKGIWLAKDKIHYDKLADYVGKYNKNVVAKRLGYILEILDIKQPGLSAQLRKYVKERYDLFDPALPRNIIDKNKWRLIDNIGKRQILDSIRY
jgi:predicted transcriptional regulator of viral defense system